MLPLDELRWFDVVPGRKGVMLQQQQRKVPFFCM
jgi:hypothetical protein